MLLFAIMDESCNFFLLTSRVVDTQKRSVYLLTFKIIEYIVRILQSKMHSFLLSQIC